MNRHARTSLPTSFLRLAALMTALLCAVSACASSSAQSNPPSSSPGQSGSSVSPGPSKYVALGDSYTSAPLVPVTDVANGCFRSSANYPSLVAKRLGADLEDRSCGGAVRGSLTKSQFPGVPAQLTALSVDTDLVTIGIGGNDGGVFRQLTRRCTGLASTDPDGAPCKAALTSGGRNTLLTTLEKTGTGLAGVLNEIKSRAPEAKVLVVGYPQIVAADDACDKLPLARGDYPWAAKVNLALNTALKTAAATSGATYVDVYAASKGHDVCSDDPWINGAATDQKRAAAYHPFAVEQVAVAKLVAAAAQG